MINIIIKCLTAKSEKVRYVGNVLEIDIAHIRSCILLVSEQRVIIGCILPPYYPINQRYGLCAVQQTDQPVEGVRVKLLIG